MCEGGSILISEEGQAYLQTDHEHPKGCHRLFLLKKGPEDLAIVAGVSSGDEVRGKGPSLALC